MRVLYMSNDLNRIREFMFSNERGLALHIYMDLAYFTIISCPLLTHPEENGKKGVKCGFEMKNTYRFCKI